MRFRLQLLMTGFDWPAMLRAGLQGLRLRPDEFWALTPIELLLMLGLESGGRASLSRGRLAELSSQFPDKTKD